MLKKQFIKKYIDKEETHDNWMPHNIFKTVIYKLYINI